MCVMLWGFRLGVFLNNIRIIMCAKPVSIDVNSSLLMGVLRICPCILPPQAALENIYKAWQKNRWRCVALRIVSRVLLQMPAYAFAPFLERNKNLVESTQWRALVKNSVLQIVVVVAPYGEIK